VRHGSPCILRDYQARAVDGVLGKLEDGARSVCLIAPTGAGKTAMGAALVQDFVRRGLRVLWVAHRIELVEQAVARMGVPTGVIVAGACRIGIDKMPCVVASLQTLARREMPPVDVLFIDEAHHVLAASYGRCIKRAGNARLIGMTATPTRLDGKPLGSVFAEAVSAATVVELIDEGHLVKPRVFTTPIEPDLRGVTKTGGDFSSEQLDTVVNTATLRGDIVRHWQESSAGRPTVLFAVSIEHSKALVQDFAAVGVRAVHVDGAMSRTARIEALQAVRTGNATVLCNVGIVTEGYDDPALETCVLARPTASLSLLLQMVGRVMRPAPGKTGALCLDHAGNFARHGVLPWSDIDWVAKMQGVNKPKPPGVRTCPCMAILPAGTQVCPVCGHVFEVPGKRGPLERKPVEVDNTVRLTEITDEDALLVNAHLERRSKPASTYITKLAERFAAKKTKPAFTPYVRAARGAIGVAFYKFRQDTGKWP